MLSKAIIRADVPRMFDNSMQFGPLAMTKCGSEINKCLHFPINSQRIMCAMFDSDTLLAIASGRNRIMCMRLAFGNMYGEVYMHKKILFHFIVIILLFYFEEN